jgi:hypothetical protein
VIANFHCKQEGRKISIAAWILIWARNVDSCFGISIWVTRTLMIMTPDLDLGREGSPEQAAAPFSFSTASLSRRTGVGNAAVLGVLNNAASRQAWPAARRSAAPRANQTGVRSRVVGARGSACQAQRLSCRPNLAARATAGGRACWRSDHVRSGRAAATFRRLEACPVLRPAPSEDGEAVPQCDRDRGGPHAASSRTRRLRPGRPGHPHVAGRRARRPDGFVFFP